LAMWIPFMIFLLFDGVSSEKLSRFTNIKCEVLDPSYCAYEKCYLKVLGRGIVGLNVQAKLLKAPFNNAKVNLSLWRKFNGFRPFMFNVTFDFCKLMSQPNGSLSFQKIFFDSLAKNSNINHSCPYENEIVVHDLVFKNEYLKYLPLPTGEYQVQFMAATDKDWKTKIEIRAIIHE
ncbi:hypothetical protein KR044_011696, partial [Drosophila immigrans]